MAAQQDDASNSLDMLYDVEAEENMIRLILCAPDIAANYTTITPDMFSSPEPTAAWRAFLESIKADEIPDLGAIAWHMAQNKFPDALGWLVRLDGWPIDLDTASQYARRITAAYQRRRLWSTLGAAAKHATSSKDPATFGAMLVKQILDVLDIGDLDYVTPDIGDVVSDYVDTLEYDLEHADRIIKTGFVDLDMMIGGLRRKDLIVLAALTGQGKSAIAWEIMQRLGRRFKVQGAGMACYVTLEMGAVDFIERSILGYDPSNVIDSVYVRSGMRDDHGNIDGDTLARIQANAARIQEELAGYIRLEDRANVTIADLEMILIRFPQISVMVLDQFDLLDGDGKGEYERLTANSRKLKALARRRNVTLIVLTQLNTDSAERSNKKPAIKDYKGTRQQVQDADLALALYRPSEFYPALPGENNVPAGWSNYTEMHIIKHRRGHKTDNQHAPIPLFWRFQAATYDDWPRHLSAAECARFAKIKEENAKKPGFAK